MGPFNDISNRGLGTPSSQVPPDVLSGIGGAVARQMRSRVGAAGALYRNIDSNFDDFLTPKGGGGAGAQFGHPFQVTINEDGDAVIDSGTASYLHKSYDAADSQSITNLNTAFTLGTTTHAWIEINVDSTPAVTSAQLLTGTAFPDLVEDDAGSPPEQTKYNLPVGRIVSGAQPGMPGFDITISGDPYHWQQLLREHQILLLRCVNGVPCLVSSPWQGV